MQVEKAVEIVYAWGPSSDQTLKAQAYDFLDQVRSEPQGWSACLPLVIRRPRASEVVRIFSLDVLNHAIQSQAIDAQSLVFIRDNLLQYVRSVYVTPAPGTDADQDPNSIQNKLSQTFTYLFTEMYASQWTTFFVDLLSLTHTADLNAFDNAAGIRLYLRTVGSIHDEIGDIYVARSPQEHQRDNNLKDLVRERDMQQITQSWTKILQQFKADEGAVIELCLKAIGKWSGWTDLSLIINDALLNLLFGLVYSGLSTQETQACRLRDVSLHTIMEILGKKMKGQDKLDLIDVLRLNEVVAALTSSTLLQELRFSPNYDTDLAELVAKLVNHTVLDIVHVLENTPLGDPVQSRADTQLKTFLPFVLRFFSDEYDEICSSVIPCLTDLLTFFRKRVGSNSDYTTTLPPILQAIVAKMKYDETSDWGSEDSQTDEAEFQELRKRLQVLQQAVAAVDESLYINTISTIVGTAFEAFQNNKARIGWRDVDLALHEMFLFGQLAVKNGGLYSKTKPVSPAAERLISMMFKLLECGRCPGLDFMLYD